MPDSQLWRVIQSWMDGQIVRVNQAQLAEALGVNRQSLSQWKHGQARPSPESLRAIRRVTRLDWHLLTEALLTDLGYVEEEEASHVPAPITRAGESPAAAPSSIDDDIAPTSARERRELDRAREAYEASLPPGERSRDRGRGGRADTA
jgi:transcriptional regulator with XRE-family HTH domain